MAVFELTGFTAQAEVLGSAREVSYEDGRLEVRGVSLSEAKQLIERLSTGTLQAVSVDSVKTDPAPAPEPEKKPKAKKEDAKPVAAPAPSEAKPAPTPAPSEVKAPTPPPEAAQPATNGVTGYNFEAACTVAKDWTALKQPVKYLIDHGVKDYPAVEAEVLKMREKGVLSFFKESENPQARIKKTYEIFDL